MPRDVETQLLNASRDLVLRIQQETGVDPQWENNGGIYVARTKVQIFWLENFMHHVYKFNLWLEKVGEK